MQSVHRVRRQSWRVGVRSAQDAFAARARLRVAVEHELREALGRAFDKAAPGEAVLHIARLELRLCVASLDALPEALAEALGRELRLRPPDPKHEPQTERLEVLLRYLDSGVLAWHVAHTEPSVAASALRATLHDELRVAVRRGPGGAAASFERVEQYYFRLLQLLPENRWVEAAACIAEDARVLDVAAVRTWLAARTGIPALAVHLGAARSSQEMLAALAAAPLALSRHEAHRLAASILAALRFPALCVRMLAALDRTPNVENQATRESAPTLRPMTALPRASVEGPLDVLHRPQEPVRERPRVATVMASNCGLVLLHPFLPALFKACGFLEKDRLRKIDCAAALLHWLATGHEEVFEFELGFVKLVLGLAPDAPLPVDEGLVGAREREEGEALLRAAIAHWKALGNTTLDGLRVSFLQRRGALRDEEGGWRLQLEPESFDVLLGRLPWAIATVKLPWMTRPLYTDWPTP